MMARYRSATLDAMVLNLYLTLCQRYETLLIFCGACWHLFLTLTVVRLLASPCFTNTSTGCALQTRPAGVEAYCATNTSGSVTPYLAGYSSAKHETSGYNSDIAASGNPVIATVPTEGQLSTGGESGRVSLPLCDEPMLNRSENVTAPLALSDAGNDEYNPNSIIIGCAAASLTIAIKTVELFNNQYCPCVDQ